MKSKRIGRTLNALPPLTDANRVEFPARPDSGIDTSDIPELTDAQLKDAVRGRFHRPT